MLRGSAGPQWRRPGRERLGGREPPAAGSPRDSSLIRFSCLPARRPCARAPIGSRLRVPGFFHTKTFQAQSPEPQREPLAARARDRPPGEDGTKDAEGLRELGPRKPNADFAGKPCGYSGNREQEFPPELRAAS